jgi:predicted permease
MSGNSFNGIIMNIIKNPFIIAIVLALPFSYFHISLPEIALKTIDYLSSLAIPVALLSMGGSFNFSAARKNLCLGLTASFLKIIASPLIFTLLAYFLGFRNAELGVLFFLFATPTALTSYIMARAMGSDSDLAANIIMITTLGSMFTILLGVYALKTLGAI